MTQMTQLEHDLLKNADDRLHTWIKDTFMRCGIAGLRDSRAVSIVMTCLLDKYSTACADLDMTLSDYLIIAQHAYIRALRLVKKDREDEKSA